MNGASIVFTGIVTDVGELIGREGGRFAIRSRYAPETIAHGASIACDGCCLSAVTIRPDGKGSVFTVDVSNETLSKTTLGSWYVGRPVNLERALRAGDELGGHIVSGHVDGVAQIVDMREDGESLRVSFELPQHLAPFVAPKGSVALEGTSLTVNEVSGLRFGVNLIPVTLTETTWGRKKPGDEVNVEIDLFARYVARIMEFRV
jgi:riboflavin synthase